MDRRALKSVKMFLAQLSGKIKLMLSEFLPLQSQFRELETIITVDSITGETKLESSSEAALSLSASDVPTGLTATKNWPNVNLSWVAPSSGDITPVTNYKIYRGTISGGETYLNMVGSQLTYIDSSPNLPSGYYKVSAVNAIGESSLSNEASAIFSAPSAPQNFAAVSNWPNVNLTWTAPSSNGGAPITNYKIYRGSSSGNEIYYATVGAVLSYIDSAPNPSANYYKVLAVNGIGESPLSNEASAIFSVPTAPQNLAAVKNWPNVNLTWTAPSSNGGTPITNYKIYRGASSGNEIYYATVGAVLSYIDSAPNPSANYYKVLAVNGIGESPLSGEVSAIFSVPSVPQNLTASAGNQKVILNWQAPSSDGGSTITNYNIYRGTVSGEETLFTTIGAVLTYTDTGLTNDITYYYKVSAVNGIGRARRAVK